MTPRLSRPLAPLFLLLTGLPVLAGIDDLRITEVDPVGDRVEVTHFADSSFTTTSALPFCHRFNYATSIPSGTAFGPRESKTFNVSGLNNSSSDIWLYRNGSFASTSAILTGISYGAGIDLFRVNSSTPARNHIIQNNKIGTDITGTSPIPNDGDGVSIGSSTFDNVIGGTTALSGNVIAFNEGVGVDLVAASDSVRNSILDNSIHRNDPGFGGRSGAGISFDFSAVPNDPGDADTGANNLQNFPVLVSAETTGVIQASLNSVPNQTYRIEFFSNTVADPTGHGEGETFLGSAELTTDAGGDGTVSFAGPGLPEGGIISATATDPDGNTSEFGAVAIVIVAPTGFPDSDGDGMSDAYELEHFGSETGGDPAVDDDGDGRTNLEEFIALTDPNDGNSFLAVTISPDPEGPGFLITIKTEPGRTYQLETNTDLGDFNELGAPVVGDGSVVEFAHDSPDPARFYRVRVNVTP